MYLTNELKGSVCEGVSVCEKECVRVLWSHLCSVCMCEHVLEHTACEMNKKLAYEACSFKCSLCVFYVLCSGQCMCSLHVFYVQARVCVICVIMVPS